MVKCVVPLHMSDILHWATVTGEPVTMERSPTLKAIKRGKSVIYHTCRWGVLWAEMGQRRFRSRLHHTLTVKPQRVSKACVLCRVSSLTTRTVLWEAGPWCLTV